MFEPCLLESEDGTVHIKNVLLHLKEAIRRVIQGKDWSPAFDADGWSNQQKLLRPRILKTLECSKLPEISDGLPTLRQFQAIFPRRRFIPLTTLLNHYREQPAVREPIAPQLPPDLEMSPSPLQGHGMVACAAVLGLTWHIPKLFCSRLAWTRICGQLALFVPTWNY